MAKKVTIVRKGERFRLALSTPMLELPLHLSRHELESLVVKAQVMLIDKDTEKSEIILE